ncbi:toll/interleukin-1 receptor domain-containing protein [Alistipes sp. ZOR0009]|uniref:toll/interleukin-1 receptor domain-containing protein n=1 Tax=Alistipes sp. ZOR0009 TaxID=1339253 RepID=UPI000648F645|nr:toll/interleukin-1 receptor domain-containing protein [Alistipes sp. ZOR0009]
MSQNFFISHYSKDKHIAELFSTALSRITLEQISPWFSSDNASNSGLKPGDIWFNQILSIITQSKAVVALLTPNSINRPWIYFECGIGQALEKCEVIPVCIGINRDTIIPPLGLYQCYQLNDYRSVVDFFSKLLTLFNIRFDEEMARVVIEKLVSEISKVKFEEQDKKTDKSLMNIELVLENFKNHVDKRFIEVLEKQNYHINNSTIINGNNFNKKNNNTNTETSYSILISIIFPEFKNDLFIEIRESDTFQSVANAIYNMISDYVGIWKYLEEWVIIDKKTNLHVIIREIGDLIPAKFVFRPNSEWRVEKLKKPYSILDSKDRFPYNNYHQPVV